MDRIELIGFPPIMAWRNAGVPQTSASSLPVCDSAHSLYVTEVVWLAAIIFYVKAFGYPFVHTVNIAKVSQRHTWHRPFGSSTIISKKGVDRRVLVIYEAHAKFSAIQYLLEIKFCIARFFKMLAAS